MTDHVARIAIGTIPAAVLIPISPIVAAIVAALGILLAIIAAIPARPNR